MSQLHLFQKIDKDEMLVDFFDAYYDARKNKRNTINALKFEKNYEVNLLKLFEDIEKREYLSRVIAQFSDPYSKALLSLIGTSYIHPFEDGNKRTSRMIANSMLLAHDLVPLSYRSVDEKNYKNAVIVFYELNSLIPFKQIFISQYKFSTENYTI